MLLWTDGVLNVTLRMTLLSNPRKLSSKHNLSSIEENPRYATGIRKLG
jgi:hypothetical protein